MAIEPSAPKPSKAELIQAAALQEFLKTGYMGTSLDRIAKVAQVSKPTLYSHFKDKASLFEAVVQHQLQGLQQDINVLPLDLDRHNDPQVLLTTILNGLLDRMLTNTDHHHDVIRLMLGESGRFPGLAQGMVRSIHKPVIERLSHLLATHPAISCPNPHLTASTLLGSLIYYTMTQHMLQSASILPLDRESYVKNLVSLIF